MSVVPFLRYSASNNSVTLKCGLWVAQGHWNGTTRKLGHGFLFALHSDCSFLVSFPR